MDSGDKSESMKNEVGSRLLSRKLEKQTTAKKASQFKGSRLFMV